MNIDDLFRPGAKIRLDALSGGGTIDCIVQERSANGLLVLLQLPNSATGETLEKHRFYPWSQISYVEGCN